MANGNDTDKKPESWNDTQRMLVLFLVSALTAVIFIWMFRPPTGDAGSMAVLNTLLGALVTMTIGAVGFYFNSTKGSQGKDTTIATLATNATPAPVPVPPEPPTPQPNSYVSSSAAN